MSLHINVDGSVKKVTSLYGNVNGEKKKIKSLWGDKDGSPVKIWEEISGVKLEIPVIWNVTSRYVNNNYAFAHRLGFYADQVDDIILNGKVTWQATSSLVSSNKTGALYISGFKIGTTTTNPSNIKSIKSVTFKYKTQGVMTFTDFSLSSYISTIDWTVWDKSKPLFLYFANDTQYSYTYITNLNLKFVANSKSLYLELKTQGTISSSSDMKDLYLMFGDLSNIDNIHLSGTSIVTSETVALGERQGTSTSSTSASNTISANTTLNVDKDWTIDRTNYSVYQARLDSSATNNTKRSANFDLKFDISLL